MADSLCLTIAKSDVTSNLLALVKHIRPWDLRVAESNPAGVQTKRLSKQHKMFAVVSNTLIKIICLFSGHDDVVSNITELTVLCHRSLECLGLVLD